MADKNFDTIDQLMNYAYDQVEQVIFGQIYEFVMNKLFESIEKNVFSVYEPVLYTRRSLTEENEIIKQQPEWTREDIDIFLGKYKL